ncbi:MAG: HD domain-containing protein [Parcubacteria group bacterium]|nr:HD domain-containing protein [Parcubacteria group bacterium]
MKKKKIITIPLSGDVDVTSVLPIIETPQFQRLRRVSRLGPVAYVFPGATHTQFEHALGVYERQRILNQRWRNEGETDLDNETLRTIELFALTHDIGHFPLGHVTKYLFDKGHEEHGLEIIEDIKDRVIQCGASFELLRSLFCKNDPLYKIVLDKNLGTDKLDYLDRDAYHTNFGGRPEINRLFSYIYWRDGKLVLDKKSVEEAKELQKFYRKMYQQVYLRKAALIAQLLLQKAVFKLLQTNFRQDNLYSIDDADLLSTLRHDNVSIAKNIVRFYDSRELPKLFVAFRPKGWEREDRAAKKPIKVFGVDEELLAKIADNVTFEHLRELEEKIAQIIGLSSERVLVVPPQGSFRFVPQDINLIDGDRILSMKEIYPEHFNYLSGESKAHLFLWVCAIGDREEFVKHAEEIKELLLGEVK